MKKVYLLLTLSFVLFNLSGYAGGACSPVAPNSGCASAASLTVGAACTNGTTCQGTTPVNTTCTSTQTEAVWYSFTATATTMVVIIESVSGGCYFSSGVFSGSCGSLTQIACQTNAPLDDTYSLTGLTIGNTYYIQISYPTGGPCGTNATFCISADEPTPPCDQCSNPCGTASGFATAPTTQQVTDSCKTSPFVPALAASSTHTFCYSFQATATSVDFNVIITSNCGGGNVTGFSWSLYNATCGGAIQTGTLSSLTFSGLTVGNNYVFCYTFTVPSTCTHSQHCPYFVGATVLPIKLVSFDANYSGKNVDLKWITASEINNDFYTVERTTNGTDFELVATIKGAGNSNHILNYETIDSKPYYGLAYYRLKQTDFDGKFEYSELVAVTIKNNNETFVVYPNPAGNSAEISFNADVADDAVLKVMDITGRLVITKKINLQKGMNSVKLDTGNYNKGIYFVTLSNKYEVLKTKFVKE